MGFRVTLSSAAVASLIAAAYGRSLGPAQTPRNALEPIAAATSTLVSSVIAPPEQDPVADAEVPSCPDALVVSPERLASAWPSLIGQRVAIEGVVIERALGFTEFLVTAGGVRFAVLMGPDQAWQGRARRTFLVVGSTRVALHGRTSLPELVLDDAECGR